MSDSTTSEGSTSIDIGVKPGDVLAGKYKVEQVLGVGGMGVVVAAHHIQLDEKVALKFLLPHALTNAEAIARFEREARAAVKIKSEHVARVSDVGKLESGSPYMVMEYLHGSDLAAMLEKRGPLPIEEAVEFVLQACEAIAEAHALGIVHRDLKPANLFCVRRADGRLSIKVLDFGISKLTTGSADVNMTRTTAIMGSPLYMSPEQLQSSKKVDARSDIWALGVVIFELVTGRPPFDAQAVTELVIKIATQPPASVRSFRIDVPAGLEAVVKRCLEKEADQRYRNIGELAQALEPFAPKRSKASVERILGTMEASGHSIAPPSEDAAATVDAGPSDGREGAGTVAAWGARTSGGGARAKKGLVGAAAGGAALLLLIGGLALTRKAPPAAPQSAAAPAAPPSAALVTSQPTQSAAATVAAAAPERSAAPPAPEGIAPATAVAAPAHRAAPGHAAAGASPLPHVASAAPAAPAGPPAPAGPAGKVSCVPPYVYDANGTRVFKKECL